MSDFSFLLSLRAMLPNYKLTHEFQDFYTVLEFAMSFLAILELKSRICSQMEGLMYLLR